MNLLQPANDGFLLAHMYLTTILYIIGGIHVYS